MDLRWGISTCQWDCSSGSVTWQAYSGNTTKLYSCISYFNFADQSGSRFALPIDNIDYYYALPVVAITCKCSHSDQSEPRLAWPCQCAPSSENQGFGLSSPDPFPPRGWGSGDETINFLDWFLYDIIKSGRKSFIMMMLIWKILTSCTCIYITIRSYSGVDYWWA